MTNQFKHTPEEARKLWVEALRSGKFKQTRRCLADEAGYCCLGVACEVFGEHETPLDKKEIFGCVSYDGNDARLPDRVMDWLGLRNSGGDYQYLYPSLAGHNDAGMPFDAIADLIDSEPPGLLKQLAIAPSE